MIETPRLTYSRPMTAIAGPRREATTGKMLKTRVVLLLFLGWVAAGAHALGPREELYEISAKDLSDEPGPIFLPAVWKFHPGDRLELAAQGTDDDAWELTGTRLRSGERPDDWHGLGWFRLRFRVSPGLRGVPPGPRRTPVRRRRGLSRRRSADHHRHRR